MSSAWRAKWLVKKELFCGIGRDFFGPIFDSEDGRALFLFQAMLLLR